MNTFLIILSIVELFVILFVIVRSVIEMDFLRDEVESAIAVAKDYRTAYEGRVKITSRPNRFWTWLFLIFCAAMLWIIFRRQQRSE